MPRVSLIFSFIILYGVCSCSLASQLEYVLVTNEKSNSVSLIDIETLEVIKEISVGERPRGLGVSPDNSEICSIAVSGENKIKVIEPDNFKVLMKLLQRR